MRQVSLTKSIGRLVKVFLGSAKLLGEVVEAIAVHGRHQNQEEELGGRGVVVTQIEVDLDLDK